MTITAELKCPDPDFPLHDLGAWADQCPSCAEHHQRTFQLPRWQLLLPTPTGTEVYDYYKKSDYGNLWQRFQLWRAGGRWQRYTLKRPTFQ